MFNEPFELETDRSCSYDYLKITEKKTNELKAKVCGEDLPTAVTVRGSAKLVFQTDATVTKKGFHLRYEIHPCGGIITEETEIHSPIHPEKYFHNLNCTWTIEAPTGKSVELKYEPKSLIAILLVSITSFSGSIISKWKSIQDVGLIMWQLLMEILLRRPMKLDDIVEIRLGFHLS
jgi:hypothetical protein